MICLKLGKKKVWFLLLLSLHFFSIYRFSGRLPLSDGAIFLAFLRDIWILGIIFHVLLSLRHSNIIIIVKTIIIDFFVSFIFVEKSVSFKLPEELNLEQRRIGYGLGKRIYFLWTNKSVCRNIFYRTILLYFPIFNIFNFQLIFKQTTKNFKSPEWCFIQIIGSDLNWVYLLMPEVLSFLFLAFYYSKYQYYYNFFYVINV